MEILNSPELPSIRSIVCLRKVRFGLVKRKTCNADICLLIILQDNIPLAYPSLLGHRLLFHLNHPLFTLVAPEESADSANLLSNFNSLQSDLPNDIFMVTLRSIADKQRPRPSGEALLVLHRLGYDCNFECKCLATTSRGQVSKMC